MEAPTEAQRVGIDREGGTMNGFLCLPAEEGRRPAVAVVHEIYGVTGHTEDLTCRFARQGYVTLAPDLFWRVGTPNPSDFTDRAAFLRFRQSLDDEEMLASLDAAVAYLRALPQVDVAHVGIVGFCMGGYYAFLEAAHNPSLAACVGFYGAPVPPLLQRVEEMRVPVLGLFGEEDQSIPVEQVHQLEAALRRVGTPVEVHLYPGAGHAFFNDTSPTYRRHAAEDAWPIVLTFFGNYLKT